MELQKEIECLPNEEWRAIRNFEGIYAISDKGRLASRKKGYWNILSTKSSKGDYLTVVLTNGDNILHTRLHRLVYEAFVNPIPQGKKNHIHHLNGNKQDNRVENLVFHTAKEHNFIHTNENPFKNDGMIFYNKYVKTKRIAQYDLSGNIISVFANGAEASLVTGVCQRNILQVANKEPYNKKGSIRKQAGGYIWKFAD